MTNLFGEPDPTTCRHNKTELARLITSSGATHIIRRCVDCDRNVTGGNYLPHERTYERVDSLPIWRDYRHDVAPCERCGARGAELHHIYPTAIAGRTEAETWPTVWLCVPCHGRWHLDLIRAARSGQLGTP